MQTFCRTTSPVQIQIKSKLVLQVLLSISFFLASSLYSIEPIMASESLQQTSAADRTEAKQFKFYNTPGKPKIGLVLGGGGARGAAHVGVLKILEKEGIKFDMVVGTSIGAVVGGFYCLGAKPEQMEEPFLSGEVMRKFMIVSLPTRIIAAPILYIPRLLGANPYDGLYGGNTFRNYLMGGMTSKDQKIEDLKTPFAAVSFNLVDGKAYMIRKGNLGYAMQASCAVPSLRKPIEMDGQLLCDGGIICNLPVKQCRELGADIVIAVNIDEPFTKWPLKDFRRPGSVADRLITWALYDLDDPQEQLADIVIHPDTSGVGLISTSRKDAKRAMLAGEKAATDALPLIREKLGKLKTAELPAQ